MIENYTQARIINAGMALRRLVNTEEFGLAIELVRDGYLHSFAASKPSETQHRETLYHKLQVLEDVVGTLNALVLEAEQDHLRNSENFQNDIGSNGE